LANIRLLGYPVTFVRYWKISEVDLTLGLLFEKVTALGKRCVLNLRKHGFGYILGGLFGNSSGHPVKDLQVTFESNKSLEILFFSFRRKTRSRKKREPTEIKSSGCVIKP
jgi:hypothetical protein